MGRAEYMAPRRNPQWPPIVTHPENLPQRRAEILAQRLLLAVSDAHEERLARRLTGADLVGGCDTSFANGFRNGTVAFCRSPNRPGTVW